MKLTVLLPTYRRSKDLERCLEALKRQSCPADELLVVVRDTDDETRLFLDKFDVEALPLRILTVNRPGVIAAMNLALDHVSTDIVAITDDDAAPHHDWLAKIRSHYMADVQIGAVGGKDWLYIGDELQDASGHPGASNIVGKLQWFGRMIGNHHIGFGASREVDFLKGVNSSYRMSAIKNRRFDVRLLGHGAQVHHEIAFCLALKKQNWKIIYDPSIAVDHYSGQRFEETERYIFNREYWINMSHNEMLVMLENLSGMQKVIYIIWVIIVGTRGSFGIFQMFRFWRSEKNISYRKFETSMQGRWQVLQTLKIKN
jgi:glycosyltransferase involved in cell wall biosynthesis